MVWSGHCTWNDCAAAGSAATQDSTNKMNVVLNALFVICPPSSFIAVVAAIVLSLLRLGSLDRVHAASILQKLSCTVTKTLDSPTKHRGPHLAWSELSVLGDRRFRNPYSELRRESCG
jgi:hypothetical protein